MHGRYTALGAVPSSHLSRVGVVRQHPHPHLCFLVHFMRHGKQVCSDCGLAWNSQRQQSLTAKSMQLCTSIGEAASQAMHWYETNNVTMPQIVCVHSRHAKELWLTWVV